MTALRFPFGQPIVPVRQVDRTPKRVFVLGVYASAVHARWQGPDRTMRINALAVASEPCIFWTGDGAAKIIAGIDMLPDVGSLVPASEALNGPSGRTLDAHYLSPLGLTRSDAWLSDLLPESRLNPKQVAALIRAGYPDLAQRGVVPAVDLDAAAVPVDFLTSTRPSEILAEIEAARPDVLITLGDQPIADFVGPQAGILERTLRAFGADADGYGRFHAITLGGRTMQLLPLVHPRQAGALGASTPRWTALHAGWTTTVAPGLLSSRRA